MLEGFKYDCHVLKQQIAGIKNITGMSGFWIEYWSARIRYRSK
jgi:hypothetical protein